MQYLMDILPLLFQNLLPLYILIIIGWIAGRYLNINIHSIARVNLFILLPVVTFGAIMKIDFNPEYLLLPLILMGLSYGATFLSFKTAKHVLKDNRANLVGAGTVNGNAIYFGLPIILFLYGPEWAGVYLLMNLGPMINSATLANYLTARGQLTLKSSLIKIVKFPSIHAAWVAILLNAFNVEMTNPTLITYWNYAAGALTILGMMMVGIGLSKLSTLTCDWRFIITLLISKHLLWPLIALSLITADMLTIKLYQPEIYKLILIWCSMPVMGNLVAYAAEYNLHPERAATGVLISSLCATASIPIALFLIELIL